MDQPGFHGPLGQQVVEYLRQQVVSLAGARQAQQLALTLEDELAEDPELVALGPVVGLYTLVLDQAAMMTELLGVLPPLEPVAELLALAEERYQPDGSPIPVPFFQLWANFDACHGPARETLGTVLLDVGTQTGMDPELLRHLASLQQSRLGLYQHQGQEGEAVVLRELVTGHRGHYLLPGSHAGVPGELWLTRVLPPPGPGHRRGMVCFSPVVMRDTSEADWKGYLERHLPSVPGPTLQDRYATLMKWGLGPFHWHEYLQKGCVEAREEVLFVAGVPDAPRGRQEQG